MTLSVPVASLLIVVIGSAVVGPLSAAANGVQAGNWASAYRPATDYGGGGGGGGPAGRYKGGNDADDGGASAGGRNEARPAPVRRGGGYYQGPTPLAVWIDERQIERLIGLY